MDRKKLIKKKYETILRIQDWYEKLQKETTEGKRQEQTEGDREYHKAIGE